MTVAQYENVTRVDRSCEHVRRSYDDDSVVRLTVQGRILSH